MSTVSTGRPPSLAARAHERDARRRYAAALAAALDSLRRAERRFDESAAAIEEHIQRALAAAGSLPGSPVLRRATGGEALA